MIEEIRRVKAQLEHLTGKARTGPLILLAQNCMQAGWREGLTDPHAAPYLEDAVAAAQEAYGYLDEGDPARPAVALLLGIARTMHGATRNPPEVEDAILALEEALGTPGAPAVQADHARVFLSMNYLGRVMRRLGQENVLMSLVTGGAGSQFAADFDRTTDLLRTVISHAVSRELTEQARTTLDIVEEFRETLAPRDGTGLDFARMGRFMASLPNLMTRLHTVSRSATGLTETDWTTMLDQSWPTNVPPGSMATNVVRVPDSEVEQEREPAPRAEHRIDVEALRRATRALLPEPEDLRASALTLLGDDAPTIDLDRLIALASGVLDAADPPLAADYVLLALGLCLRARRDDGGWSEPGETPPAADAQAAAERFRAGLEGPIDDLDSVVPLLLTLEPLLPESVVSQLTSISRFGQVHTREFRLLTELPVFIADPRGRREWSAVETMLLRRAFYPQAVGIGALIEDCDGPGTAEDAAERIACASLLHLACEVDERGLLELADGTKLDVSTVTAEPGGLAVLPAGCFTPLADTLIGVGFAGVVGWRRPVPEIDAAVVTFVLHWHLVEQGLPPVDAVHRTNEWSAKPDLSILPPLLTAHMDASSASEAYRDLLVYRGG